MPKPTGQIVPLKTQLASTVNLVRFADSSDLLTNVTTLGNLQIPTNQGNGALYEDRVYDASGWAVGQSAPNVTPVITGLSGPPVLSAPTVSPTGGHLATPCTLYWVTPVDTLSRGQRAQCYVAQFPNSGTLNSVVLTFNITGMANVNKWYISKIVFNPDGSTTQFSFWWTHASLSGQTAFTFTDPYPSICNPIGNLSVAATVTPLGGYVAYNVANLATTVTGTWTMTGAVSNFGGNVNYANGHYIPVSICAYNKVGATTNSTVQYVNLGYVDLVATGPTVTATPATTSGTLAAGTYYYRVTATTAWGESTPGPEITGTLAATGNITLSWSAVTGATGYNVYRGTATGNEMMLASVSGVSCLDAGNPVSTIPLPTSVSGCGPGVTSSITYSWAAVTNAIGYRLFTAFNTNFNNANTQALPTTTGTTYTATGLETVANTTAQVINNTGSNLVRVAKQVTMNGTGYITKIGMTFTPVAGKNYRAFILYGSMYSGTWVTAPSNATQYLEFPAPAGVQIVDTQFPLIGIEGADATCLIGLSTINVPVADWSGAFAADGGTWVGTGNTGGTPMTNVGAFTYSANLYLLPTVTSVYAGGSALSIPMRITRRLQNMTTQLTKQGTLSGLASPSNQYMCTTNYTYSTAIRSIIPSWAAAVGTAGTMLAEVSPDNAVTWYPLSNGSRFTFPTATTTMMFRYTVPGNTQTMTLLPGVNGMDAIGAYVDAKNGYQSGSYFTADTGQTVYYYNGHGNSSQDLVYANGVAFSVAWPSWRSSFAIAQAGTADADVSAWIDTSGPNNTGSGIGGVFARSSVSNTSCGYLLNLDYGGALGLYALVNQSISTLPTALAAFATGLNKSNHRVRLIVAGSHLMGLVDGQVYIDIIDSTIAAGSWAGVVGTYSAISSGFTVNNASTAAPAAQMESFSAFLEY